MQGLGELVVPPETHAWLLEPYCRFVTLEFTYGDLSRSLSIDIPFNCFNAEVSSPGYRLPLVFPDVEEKPVYRINLPKARIQWVEGIRQFAKYLNPPHKNNKRVTNSPIIPAVLTSQNCLPLYLIAKRCHFARLAGIIEGRICAITQITHALDVVQASAVVGRDDFPFLRHLLQLLARSLSTIPMNAFRGIEMSKAIVQVLRQAKPKIAPPAVVEWLYVIFGTFASTLQFEHEIEEVMKSMPIQTPRHAFIAWCFSAAGLNFPGKDVFSSFAKEFLLDRFELCYDLPSDAVMWLLDIVDKVKNEKRIPELICGWIDANEGNKREELFVYALSKEYFKFNELSGMQLGILLPLANALVKDDVFNAIVAELNSDIAKWRTAIECKGSPELHQLSWTRMLQAFDLRVFPRPQAAFPTLTNEMRLACRKLDSRFFHWLIANRDNLSLDMIVYYLNSPATNASHAKRPYRRVVIIDLLNQIVDGGHAHHVKVKVIHDFEATANFIDILRVLVNKAKLQIGERTLDYLKQHSNPISVMVQYVRLIQRCLPPEAALQRMFPVNELSVATCLAIASAVREVPPHIVNDLSKVVRAVLGFQPLAIIKLATQVIPFHIMFGSNFHIRLVDEDLAVYYFFSSSMDPQDISLVNWAHISLRAASMLWPGLLPSNFQFDLKADSILQELVVVPHSIAFDQWLEMRAIGPRPGTLTNLAYDRPRDVLVYVLETGDKDAGFIKTIFNWMMSYIGLATKAKIQFVTPNTHFNTGRDVILLYIPPTAVHTQDYAMLLSEIIQNGPTPLVMSARAALIISHDYPQLWVQLFIQGFCPQFLDNDEFIDEVQWIEPSPTLLPHTKDLFVWKPVDRRDLVLHSIGFRADGQYQWHSQMSWTTGRVIAATASRAPITFFNFDFLECWGREFVDDNDRTENWIRFRQMALTILSLLCESMASLPFRCEEPDD
jgi:hypothetical protein